MIGGVPGFEIAGYPRALLDAFSSRRREILSWLEKHGLPFSAALTQQAALITRRRKAERGLDELKAEWTARAEALGVSRDRSIAKPGRGRKTSRKAVRKAGRPYVRTEAELAPGPPGLSAPRDRLAGGGAPVGARLGVPRERREGDGAEPRAGAPRSCGDRRCGRGADRRRPPGGGERAGRALVRHRRRAALGARDRHPHAGGEGRGQSAGPGGDGLGAPRGNDAHRRPEGGGADDRSLEGPHRGGSGRGGDRQDDDAARGAGPDRRPQGDPARAVRGGGAGAGRRNRRPRADPAMVPDALRRRRRRPEDGQRPPGTRGLGSGAGRVLDGVDGADGAADAHLGASPHRAAGAGGRPGPASRGDGRRAVPGAPGRGHRDGRDGRDHAPARSGAEGRRRAVAGGPPGGGAGRAGRGPRGSPRRAGCDGGAALAGARSGEARRDGDPGADPLHPRGDPPRRARRARRGRCAARARDRDRALRQPPPHGGAAGGRAEPRAGRLRDLPLARAAAPGDGGGCLPRGARGRRSRVPRPPHRADGPHPAGRRLGALPLRDLRDGAHPHPRGRPDPLDGERQEARAGQRRRGGRLQDRLPPGAVRPRERRDAVPSPGRSPAQAYRPRLEHDGARGAGDDAGCGDRGAGYRARPAVGPGGALRGGEPGAGAVRAGDRRPGDAGRGSGGEPRGRHDGARGGGGGRRPVSGRAGGGGGNPPGAAGRLARALRDGGSGGGRALPGWTITPAS